MTDPTPAQSRVPLTLALGVFVVHTIVRALIIFGPGTGGPSSADEVRFHLPVIELFAETWPALDLSDYRAAATPWHHITMALLERSLTPSLEVMRLISGTPMSLMLALLVWWCAKRVGTLPAIALLLPLAMSTHTTVFATIVLPESPAWLFVGVLLMLALTKGFPLWACALGGVVLLMSAGVRQMTLWCAAPLWTAGWLAGAPLAAHTSRVMPKRLFPIDAFKSRAVRAAITLAFTLPAFALVAWFYNLWGGLGPPTFQTAEAVAAIDGGVVNQGLSPSAPAFMLCLIGVAGFFFLPTVIVPLKERVPLALRWGLLCAGVALLLSLTPPTFYSVDDGRWGGLWAAARMLPVVSERSLFIAVSGCFGGIVLAWIVVVPTPARVRWVLLGSFIAAMAAHGAGAQVYQRYMEPFVLIALPLAIASCYEDRDDAPPAWTLLGPLVLALLSGALAATRIGAPVPL